MKIDRRKKNDDIINMQLGGVRKAIGYRLLHHFKPPLTEDSNMTKKVTTEEFISRAKSVHGNRYGYSKSKYKNNSSKLIINCEDHGDFEQAPKAHLRGQGCHLCARREQAKRQILTSDEFLSRASKVHGDKYDYSKSTYVSSRVKITIKCSKHGSFKLTANAHLNGQGCKECGTSARDEAMRLTTNEFIKKSMEKHGDRYVYNKSIYINAKEKIIITCKEHGDFSQEASSHIQGAGCPSCSLDRRASKLMRRNADFINLAHSVHGDIYDYRNVKYIGARRKVEIICKEHGSFMQSAGDHLAGKGCSSCAITGFDKSKEGFTYFLLGELGVKVGITNKPKQRLQQLKSSTPFDFHLIAKVKTTGAEAMRKEKHYHRKYESAGLTGFDGATEWLRYSPELMNEIMNENPAI